MSDTKQAKKQVGDSVGGLIDTLRRRKKAAGRISIHRERENKQKRKIK